MTFFGDQFAGSTRAGLERHRENKGISSLSRHLAESPKIVSQMPDVVDLPTRVDEGTDTEWHLASYASEDQ